MTDMSTPGGGGRSRIRRLARQGASALIALAMGSMALALAPSPVSAQTDYYNLDRGRPLRVEDALAIERHAIEWQLAPLRIGGARGAGTTLEVEPELAWGVAPRTQVEVGVPLARWRRGSRETLGAAGLDLAVLHALNTETSTLPALALAAHALLPAGPLGPSRAIPTLTAIATRTLTHGRVHLNASVTPGTYRSGDRVGEGARWEVGVAGDHTFVFRSLLVGAEVVARRPLVEDEVEWSAASGMRYQVGPRLAVDAGLGRDLSSGGEWFVTFGSAVSLSLLHRFGGVR
ncbi:MAG TPA: hypothetical protein VFV33_18240 [Gemmatimonadaceae bacterium]|nr:hypothetical protein [Gemmatimonadaceae bacterium]